MLEPPLGLTYYPSDSEPSCRTRWMKETGRKKEDGKYMEKGWVLILILENQIGKLAAQLCFRKIAQPFP